MRASGMFGGRAGAPPLDRRQSLEAVPALNADVEVTYEAPDRACLVVSRRRGTGWLARFQPAVMKKTVRLDTLGTFVLGLVDGRRPVRWIVDAFAAQYQLNRREAELSIVAFLRSLAQRRLIAIVIAKGGAHG